MARRWIDCKTAVRRRRLITLSLLFGLWAGVGPAASRARAQEVRAGRGSYTLTAPAGMKLPPRKIYATPDVTGKMPTNDWWSSLAWEPFSSNHFAHPLAMRACKGGLRVSYPGPQIHATAKHVMASFRNELTLGHSSVAEFPDARVDGFDDWFVHVLQADGRRTMRTSYGHGSPFIYATYAGGGAEIRFDHKPAVWAGGAKTPALGVTVSGTHYGLFGPAGSTWSGLDGRTFVNTPNGKTYFSLAVLPDNRPPTLELFKRYAHSHVTATRVAWRYVPARGAVETTFSFTTKAREGSQSGTLFALYPHQWRTVTSSTKFLPHAYASVRGPMKLGAGSGFATVMRFGGVLPALPDAGKYDRARMAKYLADAAATRAKDPADTYWQGKAMGSLANLIPVARHAGKKDLAAQLRKTLRSRLENWLTAPGAQRKSERYFHYDKLWGTLIGQRPSYGSADQLNDHHFHYGYFIRAAAEIARTDKAWAADDAWGAMIKLLIRDVCSGRTAERLFPRLRCFDPYAGHSWASGHAKFGDGNNQESCSEAMNCWTGIILWGQATGDDKLRDLGIYLYATELTAINAYWFDVEGNLLPKGYDQTCAALVWGGKLDYATWFSGEPEHVHGIILLPIQSGSLYLGLYPQYVRRNLAGLAKLRGGYRWKHWHETLWMYEALADADKAMARFQAEPTKIPPRLRPHAYHWIATLQTLGHVDRTVTADCPIAMAFIKNAKRTYVACNMTDKPVTVRFSDGTTLPAPPGRFATKP